MQEGFFAKLKEILSNRIVPVSLVMLAVIGVIFVKLFNLQIVGNETVVVESTSSNSSVYTKTLSVPSTRGNIYDCNGNLLAYNELQYNLEMYNSAELSTNEEKNAAIYSLILLLRQFHYTREFDFYMALDEKGELYFTVEGTALLRFKKNAYGLSSISKLSDEQRNSTAQELFDFLRYGDTTAKMFQIDDSYSMEDALEIMAYRYQIFTQYPSYTSFRIVSDISDEARISFYENTTKIPGLEITKSSKRVYNDAVYFAHIIGYVGLINSTELEEFSETTDKYNENSVVGKLGVEKTYETYLSGMDGEYTVVVNSAGQIVEKTVTREPVSGNDVYLTVDRDMQIACYHIIERNLAAILLSAIVPEMDYGTKGEDASEITVPIYEVYYALISNNVLDKEHFAAEDASEAEQRIQSTYEAEEEAIWNSLVGLLAADSVKTANDVSETMKDYLSFVYTKLGSSGWGLLLNSEIDTEDETYLAYTKSLISLPEFLQYAITKNWVSLDSLKIGEDLYNKTDLYEYLYNYIVDNLRSDEEYQDKIYRTLIFNYEIKGKDLCMALFDQGVLAEDNESYQSLDNGSLSAYSFLYRKIQLLEITPAMLALEPCSGSIVATDPNTGDVICLVSYPSYDNNYLTNTVDMDYYNKLLKDRSYPMVNRATTSKTTTGSTFKPLTAIAGMCENVITPNTYIRDQGVFEEVDPSPKCWFYPHTHGSINVSDAIKYSCNYFFFEVGYRLSLTAKGEYNDSKGIKTLQKYASAFGLDAKSGVEISEASPAISNTDAVRTAIGYGHSFAPVQICRYLTTLTNEGTCYNLTLVDRVLTPNGEVMLSNSATVYNTLDDVKQQYWDAVKLGMYRVVNASTSTLRNVFSDLSVVVAGKTGTAQVSLNHPNNALFISFAPYSDPKICLTVVIPNGYASANAAYVAREVYGFYFEDENRDALLSGNVFAGNVTDIEVGD